MACFAVPFFKHLISEIFLFYLLTFISWSYFSSRKSKMLWHQILKFDAKAIDCLYFIMIELFYQA
jgi:hypothetical protein